MTGSSGLWQSPTKTNKSTGRLSGVIPYHYHERGRAARGLIIPWDAREISLEVGVRTNSVLGEQENSYNKNLSPLH